MLTYHSSILAPRQVFVKSLCRDPSPYEWETSRPLRLLDFALDCLCAVVG